jgi:hypothetical protein
LEDKKQLVDGIVLDIEPALRLSLPTGKVLGEAGAGFQIVELKVSVR